MQPSYITSIFAAIICHHHRSSSYAVIIFNPQPWMLDFTNVSPIEIHSCHELDKNEVSRLFQILCQVVQAGPNWDRPPEFELVGSLGPEHGWPSQARWREEGVAEESHLQSESVSAGCHHRTWLRPTPARPAVCLQGDGYADSGHIRGRCKQNVSEIFNNPELINIVSSPQRQLPMCIYTIHDWTLTRPSRFIIPRPLTT